MAKLIRITTAPISMKSLLANQMSYMQRNGFDVLMVSGEGKEWKDIIENEKGCRHHILPMVRQISPVKDLRALWLLYRLFKKEKPDIVHSHTPKAGLLAMMAAKFAGIKIRIHTVAGLRFMTSKGASRKLLVNMEKLTSASAKEVWPNSFSLRDYMIRNKLASPEKIKVVGFGSSNGVDLARYNPDKPDPLIVEETRKLINYDPTCFYMLNMGRIVKDKGISEVLYAFDILYRENDKLRLIVLGTFEELDPVSEEEKKQIASHPGIIQIDWSNRAEYFMHLSHLMVHASYREGFPSTLLQAGAMKCPIVCSEIEGSVDIVTHNETGLLFKAGDKEDLLSKLKTAIRDYDQMKIFAVNLRKKVESKFSQQFVHESLRNEYLRLLNTIKN